jgi:hypothetical protein
MSYNLTMSEETTWNSRFGLRKVVGEIDFKGGRAFLVRTGDRRSEDIIPHDDLEALIVLEKRNYDSYQKDMARLDAEEAEEVSKKTKRANLNGFEKRYSKVQLQRILSTLDRKTRAQGKVATRREHIERLVREGYRVQDHPRFKRIFVGPEGMEDGFWDQKAFTKIGFDYAVYLAESGFGETRSNPSKTFQGTPTTAQLDAATTKESAFSSFADMVNSCEKHGYHPTINCKTKGGRLIADALEARGYSVHRRNTPPRRARARARAAPKQVKLTANQVKLITQILGTSVAEGVTGVYKSGFSTFDVYGDIEDAPEWAQVEVDTDYALEPFDLEQRGGILAAAARKGIIEVAETGHQVSYEEDKYKRTGKMNRVVDPPSCYVTENGYEAWEKAIGGTKANPSKDKPDGKFIQLKSPKHRPEYYAIFGPYANRVKKDEFAKLRVLDKTTDTAYNYLIIRVVSKLNAGDKEKWDAWEGKEMWPGQKELDWLSQNTGKGKSKKATKANPSKKKATKRVRLLGAGVEDKGNTKLLRAAKKLPARNKGDYESAVFSAAYYAKKHGETMYGYSGNSYGSRVWRVTAKERDYLCSIGSTGNQLFSVTPDLTFSRHDITDKQVRTNPSKKSGQHAFKARLRRAHKWYKDRRRETGMGITREDLEHGAGLTRAEADALYRHIVGAEKKAKEHRYDEYDSEFVVPDVGEKDFEMAMKAAKKNPLKKKKATTKKKKASAKKTKGAIKKRKR